MGYFDIFGLAGNLSSCIRLYFLNSFCGLWFQCQFSCQRLYSAFWICALQWPFWDMINDLILTSVLKACGQIRTWEVWIWTQNFTSSLLSWFPVLLPFHDLPSTCSSLGLPLSVLYPKIWDFLCYTLPDSSHNYAARRWGERTWWKFVPSSWGHCSSEWIRRFPFLGILGAFRFLLSTWSQQLPWDWDTRESRGKKLFLPSLSISCSVSLN